VTKNFQKSTYWFVIALAFCAMRAANTFTITLAYISVLLRIVQIVGLVLKKRMVCRVCYGANTFITVMLFFAAMVDEGKRTADFMLL